LKFGNSVQRVRIPPDQSAVPEIVSNTSPLIYLHRLRRLELLPLLFGKIIVPLVLRKLRASALKGFPRNRRSRKFARVGEL
jgi:hypothetical protein